MNHFTAAIVPSARPNQRRRLVAAACLGMALPGMARAATYTWDGGGNSTFWSNAANWAGDIAPANDGTADVRFAATNLNGSSFQIADSNYSLRSLTFDTDAGGYFIRGYTLTLGAGGLTDNSRVGQLLIPIALSANQTWSFGTSAPGIRFTTDAGGITPVRTEGHALNISTAGTTTFNGVLTGTGSLNKSGNGTLVLSSQTAGNTDLTGGITVSAGTLSIESGATVGQSIGNLIGTLTVSGVAGSSVSLAGALTTTTTNLVYESSTKFAAFTQSGGTHTTGALNVAGGPGSDASYTLLGGTLTVGNGTTGGTVIGPGAGSKGSFTQSGGTHTTPGVFFGSGDVSAYTLGGGTLATGLILGSYGTFNFDGGTLRATAYTGGVYPNFSTANNVVRGGGAIVDSNGRDLTFTNGFSHGGTGNDGGLSKSGVGAMTVGATSTYTGGTTVTGGSLLVPGGTIGNAVAEVRVEGAAGTAFTTGANVTSGAVYVGNAGQGTMTQTGGDHTTRNMIVGLNANSQGTYTIQAGTLTAGSQIVLGSSATSVGTFVQNGGSVTTPRFLMGDNGSYALNGGTLTTGDMINSAGATLNLNGGTLRPSGNVSIPSNGVFNVQAGGAKIDTNGYSLTLVVPLNHSGPGIDGGLIKSGAGKLTIADTVSYTGATTVAGGTLELSPAAQAKVLANATGVDVQKGQINFIYTGTSPVAAIRSLLAASFTFPTTPGVLDSGQLRSGTATKSRGLGYRDTGSTVLVTPALFGDTDLNGQVNFNDFVLLQTNFGKTNVTFAQGDFDYNNVVNFDDFVLLQTNFGQSLPVGRATFTREQYAAVMSITDAGQVPEPASLAVLGLSATGLLRRRRMA